MSEEDIDPKLSAAEALEKATEAIASVDGGKASERYTAEAEAVDGFTHRIGDLVANHGLPETEIGALAGSLSDVAQLSNKTDIKQAIEDEVEGMAKGGDGMGPALNASLQENVEEVEIVRSTDAKQSAVYRWHINDPVVGRYEIETGESATPHFKHFHLRMAIFDVSGMWPARPIRALRSSNEWANWINPFIASHSTVTEAKGPRTVATEAIANLVARSIAYPTIEAMVERHGVRIDDDPDEGDPDEIWVPYTEIGQIAEEHGISPRALQIEVAARGLTADRLGGGVSESTFVRGEKVSYWVLDASIGEPRAYEPDPETPTERIERIMAEEAADEREENVPTGLISSTEDMKRELDDKGPVASDGGEADE